MKFLLAIVTSLALLGSAHASTEGPGKGEIKEVCVDKTDQAGKVVVGKDGKAVQTCKKIKVRKKLEGTEIPVKK